MHTNRRESGRTTQTERRLNTPLLPVSVGVFAVFYGLSGYRGWLVLLIGTAGLWMLTFLWVYFLERGLHVDRRIHFAWATIGESVPEQLVITNTSRFPAVWLEIVDESDSLVEPLRLVSDVAGRASRRRSPIHLFKRRGLYTLGPTRLRTGDPFGVYTLTIRDHHSSTILVTPPQLALSQLKIPASGWTGDQKRQSGILARQASDAGIREYAPGDSLKRIHWRSSAHQDALMVRRMETAASDDWWIFVDLQAAVQSGTGQDTTLELSIVLAASLAMRGLRERRRVGLALAGPDLNWLEPRGDSSHRWRILRALAMAGQGRHSLVELLSIGRPARRASLIVITPTTDPSWVAAAERHRRFGVVTTLLVNPADFGSDRRQNQIVAALTRSRIPCTRMPGSLLATAYSSLQRGHRGSDAGSDIRKRYLEGQGATWRSMD